MKRLVPLTILLSLLGLLAGCASYEAQVERSLSLAGVKHFFVLTNPNDGHRVDHEIVMALTSRGYQVETGPLTMMPEETQAVVTYQDHWTWDFGDHLVYLQIAVRDQKTTRTYGTVSFSAKVPTRKTPTRIADELVGRLLAKP